VTHTEERHRGSWLLSRLAAWAARPLERLSDRIHAGGEAIARSNGWEITRSTGRFGFGARIYHDPRFASRAAGTGHSARVGMGSAASTTAPDAAAAITTERQPAADREEGNTCPSPPEPAPMSAWPTQ
jgi:hypothetical protein